MQQCIIMEPASYVKTSPFTIFYRQPITIFYRQPISFNVQLSRLESSYTLM